MILIFYMIVSKLHTFYLKIGDKARECYSFLKMIVQAHLHVGFFTTLLIKHVSHKRFYLYMKFLQLSTIFKQKCNHEVSWD